MDIEKRKELANRNIETGDYLKKLRFKIERIYEIEEVWVKGWMLFNKMVEERECVKLYM